jgi:hypothetical protein
VCSYFSPLEEGQWIICGAGDIKGRRDCGEDWVDDAIALALAPRRRRIGRFTKEVRTDWRGEEELALGICCCRSLW